MIYQSVREDMDVNENERLSNLTLKTQIKIKKPVLFRSHSRVFSIDHNSYPEMSVKCTLAYSWAVVLIYFIVTVGSSTRSSIHTFKMSVNLPTSCSWTVFFTSVDKYYIWASLSYQCHVIYILLCIYIVEAWRSYFTTGTNLWYIHTDSGRMHGFSESRCGHGVCSSDVSGTFLFNKSITFTTIAHST